MRLEFNHVTEEYRDEQIAKHLKRYKNDEYEEQAVKFLAETETDLIIQFLHVGKHFPEDQQQRRIYSFTLSNKNGSYTSNFGDSLANTEAFAKARGSDRWKYTPNAYAILACMMLLYTDGFEQFCDEFGYEACDKRNYDGNFINESALKTYRACKEQDESLRKLFNEEQLEQLSQIS